MFLLLAIRHWILLKSVVTGADPEAMFSGTILHSLDHYTFEVIFYHCAIVCQGFFLPRVRSSLTIYEWSYNGRTMQNCVKKREIVRFFWLPDPLEEIFTYVIDPQDIHSSPIPLGVMNRKIDIKTKVPPEHSICHLAVESGFNWAFLIGLW